MNKTFISLFITIFPFYIHSHTSNRYPHQQPPYIDQKKSILAPQYQQFIQKNSYKRNLKKVSGGLFTIGLGIRWLNRIRENVAFINTFKKSDRPRFLRGSIAGTMTSTFMISLGSYLLYNSLESIEK